MDTRPSCHSRADDPRLLPRARHSSARLDVNLVIRVIRDFVKSELASSGINILIHQILIFLRMKQTLKI